MSTERLTHPKIPKMTHEDLMMMVKKRTHNEPIKPV